MIALGRPPLNSDKRKSNLFIVKLPDTKILDNLIILSKREGKSLGEISHLAFSEYWEKHGLGNSQTLLPSYDQGGAKSEGQLETECYNAFNNQGSRVERVDLHGWLKARKVNDAKKRIAMVKRITHRLKSEKGIEVWS